MAIVVRAQRQVEAAPVPGVRLSAAGGPETFGAGVAQGLSGAAADVARIGAEEKQKADNAFTTGAIGKLDQAELDLVDDPKNGALRLRGHDAPKGIAPTLQEFDKRLEELRQGAANDDQRQTLEKLANAKRAAISSRLSRHAGDQIDQATNQDDKAAIATKLDLIPKLMDDPARVDTEIGGAVAVAMNQARRNGWGPEATKLAVDNIRSAARTNIVEAMIVAGRGTDAQAYLEKYRGELSSDAIERLQAKVKPAADAVIAQGAVDEAWSTRGPKSPNDPVRIADIENDLRAKFKGEPDRLRFALADARERAGAHNAQQNKIRADAVGKAALALQQGVPLAQVTRSPEYLALAPKDERDVLAAYDRIQEHKAALAASDASRAAAAESRAWTREQRAEAAIYKGNYATYLDVSDPRKLSGMSRAQVQAMLPTLGPSATKDLLDRWDSFSKNDANVRKAEIDQDLFNKVADDAGLEPFKSKKSDEDKQRLGLLKAEVERTIAAMQASEKRQLERPEKEKLMRDVIGNKVLIPGFFSNTEKPAAMVTTKEAPKAVVEVEKLGPRGPEKVQVRLAEIPQEDRVRVIRALENAGRPVTEQAIAQRWYEIRKGK